VLLNEVSMDNVSFDGLELGFCKTTPLEFINGSSTDDVLLDVGATFDLLLDGLELGF